VNHAFFVSKAQSHQAVRFSLDCSLYVADCGSKGVLFRWDRDMRRLAGLELFAFSYLGKALLIRSK
jgi:hypothetical protein